MQENNKQRKAYKIIKCGNMFQLCKVLNEYNKKTEADTILVKLLTNKIKEKDVLKDYTTKKVF